MSIVGLITIASFPSSMAGQPDYLCLSILVTQQILGGGKKGEGKGGMRCCLYRCG